MIERLLLVAVLAVAASVGFYALRAVHMRRMRVTAAETADRPTLLYFWSETCAVCPTQGRYIDELTIQWDGRLRVERVDAAQDTDTAARFSVFTLPTTVLVGPDGHVHQVNYGLTDARRLSSQVAALLPA